MSNDKDRGGRILKGKQMRSYWFAIEVLTESPKETDEAEAEEDAAEFANHFLLSKGRTHESFCSVVNVHEYGLLQPTPRTKPERIARETSKPKPIKAKAKKAKKAKKVTRI